MRSIVAVIRSASLVGWKRWEALSCPRGHEEGSVWLPRLAWAQPSVLVMLAQAMRGYPATERVLSPAAG
jgi:hypothetical protein